MIDKTGFKQLFLEKGKLLCVPPSTEKAALAFCLVLKWTGWKDCLVKSRVES